MELDRAKEIIRALADGRDPVSGESFPAGSPYQQADTVRALYAALEALDAPGRRRREPRPVDPDRPKVGSAWNPEEEQRLRDAFAEFQRTAASSGDQTAAELQWTRRTAAAHGRTPGAITARLVKLGLLENTPANRAGQGNRPPPMPAQPPPAVSPDEDRIPF